MKFEQYEHQAQEFERFCWRRWHARLWGPRTGKTKATIDEICAWWNEGFVDAVLVVAPNGVHVNWVRRELPKHMWDGVDYRAMAWRQPLLDTIEHDQAVTALFDKKWNGLPILAVNTEGLTFKACYNAIKRLLNNHERVALVVDESHHFGRAGSKRTKRLRGIAKHCAIRRILTGTPIHNSPLRAFTQFELVLPGGLGYDNYTDFEKHFAEYKLETKKNGRQFPKLVGYQNTDELRSSLGFLASVILTEDCADLPQIVQVREYFELNRKQRALMARLQNELVIDLGDRDMDVTEASARLTKLQQISSGFVYDETGTPHRFDEGDPRTDATIRIVEEAGGRAIVWCRFDADVSTVADALDARGLVTRRMRGGMSHKKRDEVVEDVEAGRVDCVVGQPSVGGEGLDFSSINTIVWHSHTWDAIHREQASQRCTKMGGIPATVIDVVAPGSVDEYILDLVDRKLSVADDVAGGGLARWLEGRGLKRSQF